MKHALILFGVAVALIFGWGILFSVYENVGWMTGLYWAVTTATTVGYGDVTPKAASGHGLAIGCMLTAIPALTGSFGLATSAHIRMHMRRHVDGQMQAQAAKHDLALSGIRNILLHLEEPHGD